ncbi:MAG: MerR family transcriptional regulator [Actinobacteria bacterium]|nr:MerR family transcriptional regulator [Actinomycetota bacterium]MBI3688522.1 MerR family transcriptional regulator [Actinomycetota bacterium]
MKGLLSIGAFSQACRLSVRTLRRYDADELLVPALVDPVTGRRYYSPAQLGEARLIRLLRDLEVPLAEVRSLLGEHDPGTVRQALAAHRARLADQLAHQQVVLGELDVLLGDTDPVTRSEVARRRLPEQLVVSTRAVTPLAGLPAAFGAALGRLERLLHEQLGRRTGPTLAIYNGEGFDPDAVDVEVAVPVAGWIRAAEGVNVRVLPAVDALTTVHAGPYDRIGTAYQTLAAWAAEHGCDLGAQPREVYLVGPDRAGPEGLRTEVVWPLADAVPQPVLRF